jgi:D-alanyl-D-alanine carboxypeptidase
MLSWSNKIKVYPIIGLIKLLWAIDLYEQAIKLVFTIALITTLAAWAGFYTKSGALDEFKYLPDGIIYTLYPRIPKNYTIHNVLGANIKKEFPAKKIGAPLPPLTTAKAVLVKDRNTSKTLFEFEGSKKLAPASTTKLMTALVALDIYELEEELKVPELCTSVESSRADYKEGAKVIVKELLETLLVASAGDSACVLSTSKTSYNDFVSLMNEKAQSLGMRDTVFTNPIGLDGQNGSHYSTAEDLYTLSKAATSQEVIKEIVKKKEVKTENGTLYNTNQLLWSVPQSIGVKTGTTAAAGEVLVYEYADDLKDIIIIVMGSSDRFGDTEKILTWTLSSFEWE